MLMYCSNCKKEIPDSENKLCEECQKKVLEDIVASESEEPIKEKTKEKNSNEEFKVSKEKTKKSFNIKGIIVFLVIVAIIAVLGYLKYFTKTLDYMFMQDNTVGNTIGNIRNYGYAATQKEWIYYLSPDETGSSIGIYKIKTNGKEKQELLMNQWDILSLNVVGEYIYFIVIDPEEIAKEGVLTDNDGVELDYVNNKIYRIKTDGTDLTLLNDNEFNDDCYEIYVINDSIYYIGVDSNIYKMDLNGENKTLISNNKTGYLGITEKYILFNDYPKGEENTNTEYVTYIMNLDATDRRVVIEGERLYSINIDGEYIYYTNADKQVCKAKLDGTEKTILYDITAYNMNLSDGYLYYLNYVDASNEDYTVCIYRLKADGTDTSPMVVKKLDQYSSFIDIVDEWVIYMDSNEESGFVNLVKVDGSEEILLYSINYSDMQLENEAEEVPVEEETDTNTNVTAENENVTNTVQ